MSKKFEKDRSVYYGYQHVPLRYTGIYHSKNPKKELVLVDDYGKHYIAAYRNKDTCRVGITFLLKKTDKGFIFKDKEYKNGRGGWVF